MMIKPANVDQKLWDTLSDVEKQFVIRHEQQHEHYTLSEHQRQLWNKACDMAIEAMLKQAGIVFPER